MINKPTVLILGAGASKEFDMPLGDALTASISAGVDFEGTSRDEELLRYITQALGAKRCAQLEKCGGTLAQVARRFPSMDEALHHLSDNPDVVELGKLAIAYRIIKAEKSSFLYGAMHGNPSQLVHCEASWAHHFLGMVVSTTRRVDFQTFFDNLTVIDFNYDRVLPQYLFMSLQRDFGLSTVQAIESVSRLKILHPYGSLGLLEWQGGTNPLPFAPTDFDVGEVAKGIKTYTEENTGPQLAEIKTVLKNAAVVLILGFGFHVQNIQLLTVDHHPDRWIFL
jgi:hypothetical protein